VISGQKLCFLHEKGLFILYRNLRECIALLFSGVYILNRIGIYFLMILLVPVTIWFSGCKTKHICPAYQSSFYLDKTIADEQFSPFDQDSLPKLEELVRKTDVLLIVRLGKKKADKRMAVIPMITVFPQTADSALALADSLGADSTLAEEPEKTEEDQQAGEQSDSTGTEELQQEDPEPVVEEGEAGQEAGKKEEAADQEAQAPQAEQSPKPKKKTDQKDPEISDPNLNAEFEESFGDEPSPEDLNFLPPDTNTAEFVPPAPKPVKKKKSGNKGGNNPDMGTKEEEPAPQDDKF
jgi:hypothetical protein